MKIPTRNPNKYPFQDLSTTLILFMNGGGYYCDSTSRPTYVKNNTDNDAKVNVIFHSFQKHTIYGCFQKITIVYLV